MSLKDIIFGEPSRKPEAVPTPEWPQADGKIFVRTLTATERVQFALSVEEGDKTNYFARLAVLTACDADGTRIWDENDAAALGQKDSPPVERIALVAQRLAGIGRDVTEGMRKN